MTSFRLNCTSKLVANSRFQLEEAGKRREQVFVPRDTCLQDVFLKNAPEHSSQAFGMVIWLVCVFPKDILRADVTYFVGKE